MMIGAIAGTIAIVAITIAIGVFVDRRYKLLPRPELLADNPRARRPTHGAGEAPATAIRAGGVQVAKLRATQRCRACRATLDLGEDDHVRYNDHELIVLQFHCPRCATKRTLYVEPAA